MRERSHRDRIAQSALIRYGIAIVAAAVAVGLRTLLDPFVTGVQFITFFPAAMVVAYLCGTRAGLLTTLLCAIAGWYLFLEPAYSFAIVRPAEAISLGTFLLVSSVMSISIGELTAALERERRHHEQQNLLINELNHRVKNNLSIVQGIARQTLKPDVCQPVVRAEFESRLIALGSAHEVLTRENWEPAPIVHLLKNLMRAIGVDEQRVTLEGPQTVLEPKAAVSMTLAVHELATNAIKYGALSVPDGRVSVKWEVQDERLHFTWREQNGPAVSRPEKRGFGSVMIERALAREFGGQVTLDFRPEGVLCVIDAPTVGGKAGS